MIYKKTPLAQRGTYTYRFEGEDGAERKALVGTNISEDNEALDHLHELIDSLTDLQKETYRKVILDEMSNTDVAREEGKSEASVRKIINRIKYLIKNDKKLQGLLEYRFDS